jgi:Fe-S cluster biogenesis protein NfuA
MTTATPPATAAAQPEWQGRVRDTLNLIRPAIQADGGDVELVDVLADGTVHIRFHGACNGCPSSTMTLHDGLQRNLRARVPEVTRVLPVP